ncbi:DUF4056 domain-containing protein [Shewanella marina]|uniref:DUF4056 domain-containing protein n=1 Tax=Shewanella marina TaxID=487319 RepID=UPI000472991F|nr:DUF4056 domain-containing protein [Shewanella marina]
MWCKGLIALVLSGVCFVSQAGVITAPQGVRPCCAFGTDLGVAFAGLSMPFVNIKNTLDVTDIGEHIYNDGKQGPISSLLGLGEEKNGLIFTKKGGFIDTAHVRDTADYTYYLYRRVVHNIGKCSKIDLGPELKLRSIKLNSCGQVLSLATRQEKAAKFAAVTAFRLAQWHEIAQWFGLKSVAGFPELASAFSPEDLYSNMLGAVVALEILQTVPKIDKEQFIAAFNHKFKGKLRELGAVSADETEQKILQLDGIWWNSKQSLPNKWLLLKRDYSMALTLKPNGVEDGVELSLQSAERWGVLKLTDLDDSKHQHFKMLPIELRSMGYWTVEHFEQLADFAKQADQMELQLMQ